MADEAEVTTEKVSPEEFERRVQAAADEKLRIKASPEGQATEEKQVAAQKAAAEAHEVAKTLTRGFTVDPDEYLEGKIQAAIKPIADSLANADETAARKAAEAGAVRTEGKRDKAWDYITARAAGNKSNLFHAPPLTLPADRMFGAADPEPGEKKAEKLLDNIVWLSAMTKPVHQGGNRELIVQEYLKYQGAPDHIKSLVADGATGYGSDWVPQTWLTRWYEYIQAALVLGGVFDVLPMAGKKVELPRFGGIPESYTGAEPVTVSEDTTFASAAAIEFNAIPIKVYRNMSLELSIDAIIPAMGILQMKLAQGVAYGVERAIVDGDAITVANTTRSHDAYTTGRNAVGGCYTYWNGLRQQALTASPTANHDLSTFNIDNLVGLPKSMGIYAQNSLVNDLRWLVPQSVFWGSMFTLKDSSGNPAFLPALSGYAQSPIVVGKEALGLFMGIPVIASALMRTDLNASGVYDGSTTTKTDVLLFNRSAWMLGVQTAAAIYSLFLPVSTSWDIVAIAHYSFRHVETTYAASSAMGYNITS